MYENELTTQCVHIGQTANDENGICNGSETLVHKHECKKTEKDLRYVRVVLVLTVGCYLYKCVHVFFSSHFYPDFSLPKDGIVFGPVAKIDDGFTFYTRGIMRHRRDGAMSSCARHAKRRQR